MKSFLTATLVAGLGAGLVRAGDPPPVVLDGAGLFDQAAAERVAEIAHDLRENFGVDVCIETAKEPPGLEGATLRGKRDREIRAALRRAAQDRADELRVHGLYALITLQPVLAATVIGWPAHLERSWETSDHKRERLRKVLSRLPPLLEDGFPRQDPEALDRRGRVLVRAMEEYRRDVGQPHRPSPLAMVPALIASGALVGAWLLLLLIRRRQASPGRPLPIYQPAMQGSLFGAPAGFWVYDRLFYAERPPAGPASELEQPAVVETAPLIPPSRPEENITDSPGEGS